MGTRILALPTNRPGRFLRYTISSEAARTHFQIGTLGEVILRKPLDFEKSTRHHFEVTTADDQATATAEVIVDVMDVNDWEPRFRQNHYDFTVPNFNAEPSAPSEAQRQAGADVRQQPLPPIALGRLEAADGDKNDKVTIAIRGSQAHYFDIDAGGTLWLRAELPADDNVTQLHLIATATDSGAPPRSSSVPVTVTIEGALDRIAQRHQQQHQYWSPVMLGTVGILFALFMVIIVAMSVYIYKHQKPQRSSKNRIHSSSTDGSAEQSFVGSASNFVTQQKLATSGGSTLGPVRVSPMVGALRGSGGSSAGASTILAASLERERREREAAREKENYTATVRSKQSLACGGRSSGGGGGIIAWPMMMTDDSNNVSVVEGIITRATAARGGRLYDATGAAASSDMDRDSICETERSVATTTATNTAWNIPHHGSPDENDGLQQQQQRHQSRGVTTASKKLSWTTNGAAGGGASVMSSGGDMLHKVNFWRFFRCGIYQ